MGSLRAEDPVTRITVHPEVVLEDVVRLGINSSASDGFWDIQLRAVRMAENFEGGLFRRIYTVPETPGEGGIPLRRLKEQDLERVRGARYVVVSGDSKWQEGKVAGVDLQPDGTGLFRLEPEPKVAKGDGVMIDAYTPTGTFTRHHGRVNGDTEYVRGDVRPGGFGEIALRLKSAAEESYLRCLIGTQRFNDNNGPWRVKFWAKAVEAAARVKADANFGGEQIVEAGPEWEPFEFVIHFEGAPLWTEKAEPYCTLDFTALDADVLIDDVEVIREGHTHPSGYRDETVAALKEMRPGVLRILQGDDNTVRNTILPDLRTIDGAGSLHTFYELCEDVGAQAYYCLPATMTREEMTFFMEYIGGPTDTEGGRLRAELGQWQPWTEVLPGICIEIGNELYNFGGFGGPDYWHDLIETGKASPYNNPAKVFFTMGHQGQALQHALNADGHSTATYICWGFSKEDYAKYLAKDEDLMRWAVAYAVENVRRPDGQLRQTFDEARQHGIELALYEGNYHSNFGTGPSEPRNRLVTSIGGQVNFINSMLCMMREFGMRRQAYFKDAGFGLSFDGTTAFGSGEAGFVRVWGSVLSIEEGHQRFRPGWLALKAANTAIRGDLLRTSHAGADPTFSFTATFPWRLRDLRQGDMKEETIENVPEIYSYAFRDGNEYSLILVNLNPTETRRVALALPDAPAGQRAESVVLASDHFFDTNEPEHDVQVRLREDVIEDFRDGHEMDLPPASLIALHWGTE